MKSGPQFLQPSEWKQFEEPGRFVPRSITLPRLRKSAVSIDKPDKPQSITDFLQKDLNSKDDKFRCWSISVRADDGASWAAESVRIALTAAKPHFECICLRGVATVEGLPTIAQVVGERTFLRLAARRRVTTSFLSLRSWVTPAVLSLSFGLALLLKLLDAVGKTMPSGVPARVISDSVVWLVVGLSAAAGLAAQHLTTWLSTRTKSKSMESFLAQLPRKQETDEYNSFVDDLARELRGSPFPRLVIVDHFERLDHTTKQVVDRYFRTHSGSSRGSEFWVVFEREDQRR